MDRKRTLLAIRILLVLGVTFLAVGVVLAIQVLQGGDDTAVTTVWALSAAAVGVLLLIPAGFALAMVGKAS